MCAVGVGSASGGTPLQVNGVDAVAPSPSVNGRVVEASAEHPLLLDLLRDQLGLTGAKRSCDFQVCGACTVLVDGVPVSACCFLTADADGREVETIEGFAASAGFDEIAEVFLRRNTFQCGFCAPGFLMTLKPLLAAGELRSREDVVEALAGNLCRCTGYRAIIDAVCEIAGIDTTPGQAADR
jgi:aerobic-type carbon monoxide dehydrogenase small subunit (CoxS/CutS family)